MFGKRQSIVKWVAILCTMATSLPMVSASADTRHEYPVVVQAVTPLFSRHNPIEVTIEAPLTTLRKDRPQKHYLEGTFSIARADGREKALDLKFRTRGKYRRKEGTCDFPPIRLNFRRKQVVNSEFAGQDKLKLVTHCNSNKAEFEQFVLREYLTYRIFGELTDSSYSVRLLRITYIDTEGGEPMTKFGFVIEDVDDVARRVLMTRVKSGNISYDDLDRRQENLVNVFQYLVGNTDYSLVKGEPDEYCCHNADLMSATGAAPFTPLPYDFDFAGLVNPPYAAPHPRYDIRSVRKRLYRGQCKNNELLVDTLERFLEKKDAIYAIVDELDTLTSNSRRDVIRYLDVFYDGISKPDKIKARFTRKCIDPTRIARLRKFKLKT